MGTSESHGLPRRSVSPSPGILPGLGTLGVRAFPRPAHGGPSNQAAPREGRPRRPLLRLLLRVALGCSAVSATVAEEQLALPASADTALFANNPSNNLGASELLAVGATGKGFPARSLVRFDLAGAVPAGVRVVSARLEFSIVRAPAGEESSELRVHRMLRGWLEGRGTGTLGGPALAGEPTWTHRAHSSEPWGEPGGRVGLDFSTEVSGRVGIHAVGSYGVEGEGLAADVRGWLADPASNFGWLLLGDGEQTKFSARRIGSRESASGSEAPRLVLTLAAPSGPRIHSWAVRDGRFEFGFRAEAANLFEVQSKPFAAPREASWRVVTNFVVNRTPIEVIVSEPFQSKAAMVYRVAEIGGAD